MSIRTTQFLTFITLLFLFYSCQENPSFPTPTSGKTIINEQGEADQEEREAWIESLHQTAPGDDWRSIEAKNQYDKHLARRQNPNQAGTRSNCGTESFAGGNLTGIWEERGSVNQSGSLGPMEYDPVSDKLYSISAGGTLWEGVLDGSSWIPVNEDLRFSWNILKLIPNGSGQRLLAVINKILYYSDDLGLTWTSSTGLDTYSNNWGSRDRTIALDNAQNTIYMLVREWDPVAWQAEVNIYKSVDKGVSFTMDLAFGPISLGDIDMISPHNSNDLYVIHRVASSEIDLYKLNTSSGNIEVVNTNTNVTFPDLGTLASTLDNGTTHLYTYSNDQVYYSDDDGATWTNNGSLPTSPWSVGLNVSAFDPDKLFIGDIEAYRSYNSGSSWTKVNNWGEYYSNPLTKLHADMMRFAFFEKTDNTEFMLISNHGGISISYDDMLNNTNIAMSDLNVSQYYSVATDPINQSHIYAGAQDQGFQRAADGAGVLNFSQVISGDYGHIVFNDNGALWTVYPGGWVSYWPNPETGGIADSYTMESSDEAAWIPFLMESPYAGETVIFMAGGNVNGGSGSYIVKLQYQSGNITATNYSAIDFKSVSGGGVVSAIEVSPLDDSKWFAATSNGKFFYSTDDGVNWTQTSSFTGPGQHYLYGSTILASNQNVNTIYFGGSGYSNAGVYKSTDGGVSFSAMDAGLPATMVFRIVPNDVETMLFAATEAGPYVYEAATDQWFDLAGACTPNQTYWSVEYLSGTDIVRYGTYGRGIWDFNVDNQPLPVELTAFTARPINNTFVQLYWQTASEENNAFFVIERSHDGQEFKQLEQVPSKGNGFDTQSYESKDLQPYVGASYYRLAQHDIDGTINYSDVITIRIEKAINWAVYPNPVRAGQSLQFKGISSGNILFEMYNEAGLLVRKTNISAQEEMPLQSVVSGNYFYVISQGNERVSGKLVVN